MVAAPPAYPTSFMNSETRAQFESAEDTMRPIEKHLRDHRFFAGLTPQQYHILSDCAMLSHFDTGELVFREGDPANRFYLIQQGTVSLESHTTNRGEVRLETLGPGDALGWSWLFPPYVWHFAARALEPTDAIFIYATPLREECDSNHELGYELMKRTAAVMLHRLQATRRAWLGLGVN
jgi:CRP/FNR family cyclic AMP-dependent transcriptional regulator